MSQIKIEKNIPEPLSVNRRGKPRILSEDDFLAIKGMQVGDSCLAPKEWLYTCPSRKGLMQLKQGIRTVFKRLNYQCRACTTKGGIRVWRTK